LERSLAETLVLKFPAAWDCCLYRTSSGQCVLQTCSWGKRERRALGSGVHRKGQRFRERHEPTRSVQVTEWIIPAVCYLCCCSTWESGQGPGSCCTGCCTGTGETVYCLSSTCRRLVCFAKGRKCLSEAAIHQSLAM